MPALHWFCLFMLLPAAGCGRMGVQLYRLEVDASTPRTDAGAARDAGQLPTAGRAGSESGSGSGAGAAADSGMPYQGDASTPLPMDAGNPTPACQGALQFQLCWYLAAEDASCNDECADKGGFDTRAASYVGTPAQGGSADQCEQILTALGRPGAVAIGTQQIGLGCHIWNNGDRWWLQSPTFTVNAATPTGTGARIACACLR